MLGFAEYFNKVILNCKHDLILLGINSDNNVCFSSDEKEKIKVEIRTLTWIIPHICLCDNAKVNVWKTTRDGCTLPIAIRSWDSHFNPTFWSTGATKHNWNIKLSVNYEKPRCIIFPLINKNDFIDANLKNYKANLNSNVYPYEDLNLKFVNDLNFSTVIIFVNLNLTFSS